MLGKVSLLILFSAKLYWAFVLLVVGCLGLVFMSVW